jgi:hypothetical protein
VDPPGRKYPINCCPECGNSLGILGTLVAGNVHQTRNGEKVPGSERHIGTFHAKCWDAFKATHPRVRRSRVSG